MALELGHSQAKKKKKKKEEMEEGRKKDLNLISYYKA